MPELLLRASRRLDGPHRVTATVRPLRLAYLVDPDAPSGALAAIDACCLLWGGPHQFLIPCSPGAEPKGFWAELLEQHDPDEVIDLVGASETFCKRQQDSMFRQVRRWERPTETMLLSGAMLTSTLRRGLENGWWEREWMVRNIHPLFGHPLALQIAFAHGHLERRPMDAEDHLPISHKLSRLEEFMQIQTIDPRTLPEAELLQLATGQELPLTIPESPGWFGPPAINLIDVASGPGTATVSHQQVHFPGQSEQRDQNGNPYYRRIVVVGDPGSTLDLCLAWNLRAQRGRDRPFPFWLSPTTISQSFVQERLQEARSYPLGIEPLHIEQKWLGFVSATLNEDELCHLAATFTDAVALRREDWLLLFPKQCTFGVDRQSTAIFVEGTADVGLPDVSNIGEFSHGEALAVTITIPSWQLPRMPAPRLGEWNRNQVTRVARDGLVGTLVPRWSGPPDFVTVYARNGAEALAAVAAQAGYEANPSPPGLLACDLTPRALTALC
jgi:hypothetical protein